MSLDGHGNHTRAELEMELIAMLRRLKIAPIVMTRDDGDSFLEPRSLPLGIRCAARQRLHHRRGPARCTRTDDGLPVGPRGRTATRHH